jgi:hypothetical protein
MFRHRWDELFMGWFHQKHFRTIVKSIDPGIQIKSISCEYISFHIENFIIKLRRIYDETHNLDDTLDSVIHESIRDRYMGKYQRALNGQEVALFYDYDRTKLLCSNAFNDNQVYGITLICETFTIDFIQSVINRLLEQGKRRIDNNIIDTIIQETPAFSHGFL